MSGGEFRSAVSITKTGHDDAPSNLRNSKIKSAQLHFSHIHAERVQAIEQYAKGARMFGISNSKYVLEHYEVDNILIGKRLNHRQVIDDEFVARIIGCGRDIRAGKTLTWWPSDHSDSAASRNAVRECIPDAVGTEFCDVSADAWNVRKICSMCLDGSFG